MKKFTVLAIQFFLSLSLYAQYSIKGTVVDDKQKPAVLATVLLLLPIDSTLLQSTLTDKAGNYQFTGLSAGPYLITVQMVGHQKSYSRISVENGATEVETIQLHTASIMLSDIVVSSSKPFLEQKADKLVVNIETSATASGSNALEILKKVPGVLVRNDKVSLAGKTNVIICIDGKSSSYTDINQVLKDISAATISKIELITNPGAKYDASGGSVINIILKKNARQGTNGSISLSGGAGLYDKEQEGFDRNFYRYSPAINFNFRKGKINLFGNYSYNHRNWFEFNEFDRIVQPARYFQTNLSYYKVNSHNYRAGIDYYADKKNTVGFLLKGFNRDGGNQLKNTTVQSVASTGQDLGDFQTLNTIKLSRNNYSVNMTWKHLFDTAGKELIIDMDYSKFALNNNSNIINNATSVNKTTANQLVNNPLQFGVLKVDYTNPLKEQAVLESGIKITYASIDNFLTFQYNGILDKDRSTEFLYTENINAAYVNYSRKFSNWQLAGGLRTEQTVAKGKSYNNQVLNRNYWQLFPSVLLTRNITTRIAAVAQYSRRVDRPSYQQQNSFILFLDSLTFTKGNPALKPQLTDAFKFSFTYDNHPLFSVSYNKTVDVIFNDAPKQEGTKTFTTPENLGQFKNIAFELNFPIEFGKKVSGHGGNQVIFNHYTANYMGSAYTGKRWNWLAYWQIAYKPVATWNMEVSGYYITKFLTEFFTIKNQGALNVAIQKSILDSRGKFTLNFSDVLFSERSRGNILYQDINVKFRQWEDSRNVRLSFTYSFGNQQLHVVRNRKTASDEENSRVKTK